MLITGVSSGIGADAARHLAKLGAEVSMIGRHEKQLDEVATKINKSGAPTPLADVTTDAERIVDETMEHFGHLDVLINNAGTATHDNISSIRITFSQIFG